MELDLPVQQAAPLWQERYLSNLRIFMGCTIAFVLVTMATQRPVANRLDLKAHQKFVAWIGATAHHMLASLTFSGVRHPSGARFEAVLIAAVVAAVLYFVVCNRIRSAGFLILAVSGSFELDRLLQAVYHPHSFFYVRADPLNTFPSLPATLGLTTCLAMAYLLGRTLQIDWSGLVLAIGATLSVAIILSTLTFQLPSQVVVGCVIALGWLVAIHPLASTLLPSEDAFAREHPPELPALSLELLHSKLEGVRTWKRPSTSGSRRAFPAIRLPGIRLPTVSLGQSRAVRRLLDEWGLLAAALGRVLGSLCSLLHRTPTLPRVRLPLRGAKMSIRAKLSLGRMWPPLTGQLRLPPIRLTVSSFLRRHAPRAGWFRSSSARPHWLRLPSPPRFSVPTLRRPGQGRALAATRAVAATKADAGLTALAEAKAVSASPMRSLAAGVATVRRFSPFHEKLVEPSPEDLERLQTRLDSWTRRHRIESTKRDDE